MSVILRRIPQHPQSDTSDPELHAGQDELQCGLFDFDEGGTQLLAPTLVGLAWIAAAIRLAHEERFQGVHRPPTSTDTGSQASYREPRA